MSCSIVSRRARLGKVVVAAGEKPVLHLRFLGTSYYRSTRIDEVLVVIGLCVYFWSLFLQQISSSFNEMLLPYAFEQEGTTTTTARAARDNFKHEHSLVSAFTMH